MVGNWPKSEVVSTAKNHEIDCSSFFCPHLAWDMAHQVLTSFFGAGDLTSTCGGFPEKWGDGWWMVTILVIDDPNSTLRFFPNIAMENGPFEDVFPIEHGDHPLLCLFTRGYHVMPTIHDSWICNYLYRDCARCSWDHHRLESSASTRAPRMVGSLPRQ